MELFNEFAAVDAAHFHISDVIERRIEMASVVNHFYQIVQVDDLPLIHLHE